MEDKHLHILICSDSKYLEYVAVVVASLFDSNKEFEKITIHLFYFGKDDEGQISLVRKYVPKAKGEVVVYDVSDLRQWLKADVPETAGYIAITSYARLFAASILPSDVEKVLYIDCDTVINGSVYGLWQTELCRYAFAAVLDPLMNLNSKRLIGLSENEEYYNSGVLLINLSKWREFKLQDKFVRYLCAHNGKVYHDDQGVLNAVCHNDILRLSPEYNLTSFYLSHSYKLLARFNTPFYSQKEICDAIANPVIIHFTEGFYCRPWVENSNHPFAPLFISARAATAWNDIPLSKDRRSLPQKVMSWCFLKFPFPVYCFMSKLLSIGRSLAKLIKVS